MDPKAEEAIHNERHIRIICIGAGASGLCFAYKLQRSFRNFSLAIYEKNPDISGTWHENKYPGCACDIPAHNYTYSFEPKTDWTSVYASSQQIKEYFKIFSHKYNLTRYVETRHKITEARWQESEGRWTVTVENLASGQRFEDHCNILINAGGYLNNLKWPSIPGLENYQGQLVHSADWVDGLDLNGRRVGLIGNGSSAVQILPQIQPHVQHLTMFFRTPLWMVPTITGGQRCYSRQELNKFVMDPEALMHIRKGNETVMNSIFSLYLRGSVLQDQTKLYLASEMKKRLSDAQLEEKLIPSHSVGCRRLTPDVGFLEALKRDNVRLVHHGVSALTERGCISDDGEEHQFDAIICATGFDTSFKPRFPILGFNGKNLQDAWAHQPKSYLGIAVSGFPNFLTLLGPNSPVKNGPTLCAIEAQIDHILQLIDRYQTENIRAFSPKEAAVEDFAAHVQAFMQKTVWTEDCGSTSTSTSASASASASKRVPTLWPGSTLHCLEALRELRADDWDIRYDGNRFAWLGNGCSQAECDPTSDLAYYIRDHDDSGFASRGRRREGFSRSGSQLPRTLNRTHRLDG